MKGSTKTKVFISYSWTSEAHKQWVLDFAERLTGDGVFVIMDEWDLKPGHDKYPFMEKMVTDESVKKVLVICDKAYQEKADGRKGGVGTESQLISKEVYEKVDQEKFIPIILERDEDGEPCMPKYIASRVYFDLSTDAVFEEEYQKLLRNLFDKPDKKRPPIGEPPAYITEEARSLPKSASILSAARPVSGGTETPGAFISDYFEQFLADLREFRYHAIKDEPQDETMMKLIERMQPLRDSFIVFANRLARMNLSEEDLDLLHDFLERVAQFQFRPADVQVSRDSDWDNYKFFSYEMMLHFVAILIRFGKYAVVERLVKATYFITKSSGEIGHSGIVIFNNHQASLDQHRNARLELKRVSVTADTIKARAVGSGNEFDSLIEADLLLHYITFLNADGSKGVWKWGVWFPRLTPFTPYSDSTPIFQKLVSKRHFERVKNLFGVKTPEELRQKIEQADQKMTEYYDGISFNYSIPMLNAVIKLDSLATVP